MSNGKETSWRTLAAAGLIAGGLFTAHDRGPVRASTDDSSESPYSLTITPKCDLPTLNDSYEQGIFSLNGDVIGGKKELWDATLTTLDDGRLGFRIWNYDTRQSTSHETSSFYVPENMVATAVIQIDGKERSFSITGGNDAVICGNEFKVVTLQLDTQPDMYDETLAGTWTEYDALGQPINGRAPVGIDPAIPFTFPTTDQVSTPPSVPETTPGLQETGVIELIIPTDMQLTPEQNELVEITAVHLVELYSEEMNSAAFPDESSKYIFFAELTKMGLRLNPDNPNLANQLAAVMYFETDGSFASGAEGDGFGLLHFTPTKDSNGNDVILGTSLAEFQQLSPMEQLIYVESYLVYQQNKSGTAYRTLTDLYMAVVAPEAIGESDDFVLTKHFSSSDGGQMTIGDATEVVMRESMQKGESWLFLLTDGTAETMPSLDKQLDVVQADANKMTELATNGDTEATRLNTVGSCLLGVQNTLDNSGLMTPRMDSAYQMRDVLREDTRFAELFVTSREQLYSLPPGSILVYQPDTMSTYDDVNGSSHGHIAILVENDAGLVLSASDHVTELNTDLINMPTSVVNVFVPVQQEVAQNADGNLLQSEESFSDIHVVPELGQESPQLYEFTSGETRELVSEEDYIEALQDKFNITAVGFDKEHLQYTWEILWRVDKTTFPELISGTTLEAKPYGGDNVSEQKGCQAGGEGPGYVVLVQWPDKKEYLNFFFHELMHVVQKCNPDEVSGFSKSEHIFQSVGPISWYGGHAEEEFGTGVVLNENENYAEVGRLFFGQYFTPSYNNIILVDDPSHFTVNPFLKGQYNDYKKVMEEVFLP